jgi:hypothetical protein
MGCLQWYHLPVLIFLNNPHFNIKIVSDPLLTISLLSQYNNAKFSFFSFNFSSNHLILSFRPQVFKSMEGANLSWRGARRYLLGMMVYYGHWRSIDLISAHLVLLTKSVFTLAFISSLLAVINIISLWFIIVFKSVEINSNNTRPIRFHQSLANQPQI